MFSGSYEVIRVLGYWLGLETPSVRLGSDGSGAAPLAAGVIYFERLLMSYKCSNIFNILQSLLSFNDALTSKKFKWRGGLKVKSQIMRYKFTPNTCFRRLDLRTVDALGSIEWRRGGGRNVKRMTLVCVSSHHHPGGDTWSATLCYLVLPDAT